ncbi:myosin [Thiohalobacter thiocyanaticus]|uniref:Myosin n=1 Tax=Thiohalobacter thiocyanaticus TaxID=585455 RepID=A0A1Z4VRB3_9GAMM|nr:hypothetical protein [Thiohalobacter thiocyanaticus]BAZ94167.1 myosin [Thiohalobacter thiocyanaticus]
MIQLHIYGMLAILEVLLLVSVVAGWLYVRNRRNNRTIAHLTASLQQRGEPATASEPPVADAASTHAAAVDQSRSFSDFLREELDASSVMLGSDAAPESGSAADPESDSADEQAQVRQMLAARHQFLQLELDTQDMRQDPQARRRHIVEQMHSLLATFTPAAVGTAETEPVSEPDADSDALAREQQLESQLSHLRTVVGNQQDVMRELRQLLEQEMGESEEMREIIARLQDAEASSLELERSLEVMGKSTASGTEAGGYQSSPDSDMLRNLVGSQQQTISRLQTMLKQSVGEKETSVELRDAMEKIQRSNQELGTCVMVLEDENSMLRDQIQSLQSQLDDFLGVQDTTADAERESQPGAGVEAAQEEDVLNAESEAAATASEPSPDPEPVDDTQVQTHADPDIAAMAAGDGIETVDADERLNDMDAAPATAAEPQAEPETAAVEDIDALLEATASTADEPPPEQSPAPGTASGTADDTGASDEEGNHAGINTLKDIDLDSDGDATLSDEDIDALLSGRKQN